MIKGDELALPIGGTKRITRRRLLELATHCRLPARVAERVLGEIAAATGDAIALVDACFLPGAMKHELVELLETRAAALARSSSR